MKWSIIVIAVLATVLACVCIWAFVFNRHHSPATYHSLRNLHLLQFTPSSVHELERFRELSSDVQLQFWSNQFVLNVPIVFQLKPENVSWFSLQMDIFELPFVVLTSDLHKVFDDTYLQRNLQAFTAALNNQTTGTTSAVQYDLNVYNPLEKIEQYLHSIRDDPQKDLFELTTYGTSYEGRPLYLARISEDLKPNASHPPACPDKPGVFFECGIHAREWLSPAVCLQFIDKLLHDVQYTPWLKHFDFFFVPVFNPDGYLYSWTTDRMWRKNRRHIVGTCYGVDLNRNFGVGFKRTVERSALTKRDVNDTRSNIRKDRILKRRNASEEVITDRPADPLNRNRNIEHESESGGSGRACNRLNPGSTPFSEHETHNFHTLLKRMPKKPTLYFSMHAYSQVWIYPFGYTDKPSEHASELDKMTKMAVDALQRRHNTQWKAGGTIETLYSANGIAIDWVHQEVRVPYVFTIEMRDKGDFGFLLPEEQITPAAEEVWAGIESILTYLKENRTQNSLHNDC